MKPVSKSLPEGGLGRGRISRGSGYDRRRTEDVPNGNVAPQLINVNGGTSVQIW